MPELVSTLSFSLHAANDNNNAKALGGRACLLVPVSHHNALVCRPEAIILPSACKTDTSQAYTTHDMCTDIDCGGSGANTHLLVDCFVQSIRFELSRYSGIPISPSTLKKSFETRALDSLDSPSRLADSRGCEKLDRTVRKAKLQYGTSLLSSCSNMYVS
jgi:hypothetical protein